MKVMGIVLAVCATSLAGVVDGPRITHVGMVAPDILGITVQAGRAEYGRQVPYERQAGDRIDTKGHQRWVWRGKQFLGSLVGAEGKILYTPDRVVGAKLDTAWADRPASYRITSPNDPSYRTPKSPRAVHRKSKPTDFARVGPWQMHAPMEHVLYLRLPKPLAEGKRYTVSFVGGTLPDKAFVFVSTTLRSEAVHVTHLGFRPDDPAKVAFLSCWMGSGGSPAYREGLRFRVLDGRGKPVFEGKTKLARRAGEPEDAYKRNHSGVDVYEMDFSQLKEPGTCRVSVEGIGCSYPFRIGADVWQDAFVTAARGFFHQRNGIALGRPYTTFDRPRPFHPDDGVKIYASTTRLMDTRNGLSRSDPSNFRNLVAGATDELVAHAWGGYMDAGDWDRRIQHLIASVYLLDLAEQFSDFFESLSLNIPESDNGLPDVVDEALFNLDCYRRLQTPDGGIRGGIESEEHPNLGEASWQETLRIFAYAPGSWSSFYYAGVAGKAAGVLKALGGTELASVYETSALRAMEWAEKDYARRDKRAKTYQSKGVTIERMDHHHQVRDMRNYAAAELFRLTSDERWQRIFRETTKLNEPNAQLYVWQSHEQREGAWTYIRTERDNVDAQLQQYCRQALLREAQDRLRTQARTGFRWTKNDWAPPTATLSVSDTVSLVRAHILTQDAQYLKALVLACQAGLGANPLNLCYTTGLGHRWPHLPLHLDSRHTGQAPPEGLTVFGPVDPTNEQDTFLKTVIAPFCYPPPREWPIMESYWDVFWYPMMCEFTIHHPMSYNAYAWGYLAGLAGS